MPVSSTCSVLPDRYELDHSNVSYKCIMFVTDDCSKQLSTISKAVIKSRNGIVFIKLV